MSILSPINENESDEDNEENDGQTSLLNMNFNNNNIQSQLSYPFIDDINMQETQRSVVVDESQPLARCMVLYLGTAAPSPNQQGIDSIQEPLSKRYPVDGTEFVRGSEAWLTVDPNGLQIQFVSDTSYLLYYPIRSLVYCASVRFAAKSQTGDKSSTQGRFIPLDVPEASLLENSHNPPLFAITFQRTRDSIADECHCFVIKSVQTAVKLVETCAAAYGLTDPEQDCSKVPLYFRIKDNGLDIEETNTDIFTMQALDGGEALNYEVKNQFAGYFYRTKQVSIEFWQLWETPKNDHNRPSSRHSTKSLSPNSSSHDHHHHHHHHHRRQTSIKSSPEVQSPVSQLQSMPTNNPVKESSELITNSSIEPINDINTGRDLHVRWLNETSETSEQVSPSKKPDYDFHIDFDNEYQPEQELSTEMNKLIINDKDFEDLFMLYNKYRSSTSNHEEKNSKKKRKTHKHQDHEVVVESQESDQSKKNSRKSHKKHRHKYREVVETPATPSVQQNYTPSPFNMAYPYNSSMSFGTLPSFSQSNIFYEIPPYRQI